MTLEKLTDLIAEKYHVVSIVGGGGKSTLLYYLAEQLSDRGLRVVVTTTTHIWHPGDGTYASEMGRVLSLWEQGQYAVTGRAVPNGKLASLPLKELRQYLILADIVLIEADGAKGKPCKVPAVQEPVILRESSLVIGVAGMDCLGKKLVNCCFRLPEVSEFLGICPEEVMTPERLVQILSSEQGTKKGVGDREYVVVLNKCDNGEIRFQAEAVKGMLKQRGIRNVVLSGFISKEKSETV